MRVFAYLAASFLFAAPSQAAFEIYLDDVSVTGTSRMTFVCADPSQCPDIITPYATALNGRLSPEIASLSGSFSLSGQDRPRNQFVVALSFYNGVLLSSSLTGQFFPSAPGANPVTEIAFGASNFAVRVLDTTTGVTRIVAPIPEPATWAMMLLGFGAVGFSMRQRPLGSKLSA